MSLNARELEYVRQMAMGWSAKDTAHAEGVSEHAVKDVLRRARQKYDASTGIDLLRALGWLSIPERQG